MRRDLIIGILVSALVHGGFVFGGELFKAGPKKAAAKEEAPTVEVLIPPPLEPEEEIVDMTDVANEEPAASLAPPSLVDVPGVVNLNSITQAIQPPPPPSLGKPTGLTNIPTGRPGTSNIGSNLGNVFNLKDLDQQPQTRGMQAKPTYPFEMRRAGINGEVIVLFVVDTNGDVRDASVVRSTQREFEAAALQAVLKWKWKPGRKGGKAVAVRMQIPIVFNINDE